MSSSTPAITPTHFTNFGELLRFLRRRAFLTQRDLGIATGYSEGQISRLEKNQRLPDPTALMALFVPALDLNDQATWTSRLLELAGSGRAEAESGTAGAAEPDADPRRPAELLSELESPPLAPPYEVARPFALTHLSVRLNTERCVVLSGLAGVGKTTLAAALARNYAAMSPVFWLTLTPGVTTTFDVLIYHLALFLRSYQQHQATSLLRTAAEAKTALPFNQQVALLGAALTQLESRYQEPPLLCLDNIDLAQHDEQVDQLLRHLIVATPAALLMTARENVPLPGVAQVPLAGLEPGEGLALVDQLIRLSTAHPTTASSPAPVLSPAHTERLLAKTGGNPMLLRLALGQLFDRPETIEPAAFIDHLETQPQVSAYLLETLQQRLTPAAWRLLAFVAVFRQPLNLYDEFLIELYQSDDVDDLAAALAELQRYHLIDYPTQANLHPLVRDYVYATLLADSPRRRWLHQLAAEWLQQGAGRPVEAAYHYSRAGELELAGDTLTDQAEAIINRGRRLAALAVVDETLTQARRKRGDQTGLMRQLLTIRGDLLAGTLQTAEAEADYRAALALSAPPAVQAHIAWRLAQSLAQRGQAAEAIQLCRNTAAAMAPNDMLLLARLASVECHALWTLSRFAEATPAGEQALALADDLARLAPHLADIIRARTHFTLSLVYYYRRIYDTALQHARQLVDTARRANLRELEYSGLGSLGVLTVEYLGQIELGIAYLDQAVTGFVDLGYSYELGNLLELRATAHFLFTEFAQAAADLNRAEDILRQIGDSERLAFCRATQGLVLLAQDQVAEARVLGETLLASHEGHDGCLHTLYTLYLLVMVQLVEGKFAEAVTTARQALALPAAALDPAVSSEIQGDLALALLLGGKMEEAQQFLADPTLGQADMWSGFHRGLIASIMALAEGNPAGAKAIAEQVGERANAAGFRFFSLSATRLAEAAANPPSLTTLPRLLWIMTEESTTSWYPEA
jgi:ATP/maltotriose-dependent transcriptional regulator MalT